jgi:putative aldouronate transport system permease protein
VNKKRKKPSIPVKAARSVVRDYQLWLMVLPAIAVIFIFNYMPMYGVQLAFRDFDFTKGLTGGKFVGLKYFLNYFNGTMFIPTIRNTFTIAFVSIVAGFPAPILLALLINQIRTNTVKKTLQTTVYLPYFISTVVLVSMIRVLMSPSSGILNHLLKWMHLIPQDLNLVGSAKAFVPVYVLSGIWQACGWSSIIYFAALSSVDTQLYDAAKIDGASRLRIIWHIDIPALIPTIVILLIMSMGNVLSVGFEKTFLMQNDLNISVSEVISTYVFKIGMRSNQFSLGSAIGLFNTTVNFVFLVAANLISRKASDIGLV